MNADELVARFVEIDKPGLPVWIVEPGVAEPRLVGSVRLGPVDRHNPERGNWIEIVPAPMNPAPRIARPRRR